MLCMWILSLFIYNRWFLFFIYFRDLPPVTSISLPGKPPLLPREFKPMACLWISSISNCWAPLLYGILNFTSTGYEQSPPLLATAPSAASLPPSSLPPPAFGLPPPGFPGPPVQDNVAAMAAMLGMRPPEAPGQSIMPPPVLPGMLPFPPHGFPGGLPGHEGLPPPPFPGLPPPFPIPMEGHGPIPLDERGIPLPPDMLPHGMLCVVWCWCVHVHLHV